MFSYTCINECIYCQCEQNCLFKDIMLILLLEVSLKLTSSNNMYKKPIKGEYLDIILRSPQTIFSKKDIVLLWGEQNESAIKVRLHYYVKTGKLIVEAIQLEQQESAARHATLKQLASQSGGAVFALRDYQSLLKQLQTNEDLVAVRSEIHQFDELNDLIWICLVLISLLAIEWFLRRYHGTY